MTEGENTYEVSITGRVKEDVIPKIVGVTLLCQGFIIDYEVESDISTTKVKLLKK